VKSSPSAVLKWHYFGTVRARYACEYEAYPRPEMVAPTGRAASSIALRGLLRVA